MSDKIQKVPFDNKAGRIETGPVQFGDDWPGYFIRGDNAFGIAIALQAIMVNPFDVMSMAQLQGWGRDLMSCVQGDIKVGLLAESADAADLKPADLGHEGSSPSVPTKHTCANEATPYELWAGQMPSSELPAAVGDKRLIAIDGFGQMDAEIIKMDDFEVTLKITDQYHNGSEFELNWETGPNTWVGVKLDGEEYKKYMADVEVQALEDPNVQSA